MVAREARALEGAVDVDLGAERPGAGLFEEAGHCTDPGAYVAALVSQAVAEGAALRQVAATGFRNTNRVSTGLIGLLSLAYVGYVLFWPSTDGVYVFPLAAIIPFGAVVQAFKGPRVRTA